MTKAGKITDNIITPAAGPVAAAPATVQVAPEYIQLGGVVYDTLNTAAALIRMGYMPSTHLPPMINGGNLSLVLVKGNPDQHIQKKADAAYADAAIIQQIEREKEIEAAAERRMVEIAKAEKQAELAAQIKDAENALRRLKYAHSTV